MSSGLYFCNKLGVLTNELARLWREQGAIGIFPDFTEQAEKTDLSTVAIFWQLLYNLVENKSWFRRGIFLLRIQSKTKNGKQKENN